MKILIISSTVSQSNSVGKITTELEAFLTSQKNEVKVLYLDNTLAPQKYHSVRAGILTKLYYHLSTRSKFRYHKSPIAINRIRKEIISALPDIIQLIQPWPGYIDNQGLFEMLGNTGIPCVYTMIDENAYLGNCDNAFDCEQFREGCRQCQGINKERNFEDYNGLWSKTACRNLARIKHKGYSAISNICFVGPQWVIDRACSSYMLRNRQFFVVDEYVNNKTVFYPQFTPENKWRDLGIDTDKIIVLNVARFSNIRKGLYYFLQLAEKMADDNRFIFVNVGYDGDYQNIPENYIGIPFVSSQKELAEFYSIADLFLTTSLADTMPNVCLEALSCGTPICGFNISGIPYVADKPLGVYVEAGNIGELKKVVLNTQKKDEEMVCQCRNYALNRYSPDVYGAKMLAVYGQMLSQ